MLTTNSKNDADWLENTLAALKYAGVAIVTDVMSPELVARTRTAMYEVQAHVIEEVGHQRLDRAAEVGVVRIMPRYDPFFLELVALPEMLEVIDRTVSETAVMHLQNGLILAPWDASADKVFQLTFHRDFPRYMNGYVASVNAMLAIDEFTAENGGTLVVPGTHQRSGIPDRRYLEESAVAAQCPAGAMIVFDSTLWHAAGRNMTDCDRVAINLMFTRSFFKQQIDYVRALGDDLVVSQPPRVQQLLGWYTRVVTSLDEYYRPSEERLYRAHQG
jgi:ectoine hydroxylase-related dioxygenase (phytanoyl-CoA dioxygenase family)